MRELFLMAFVVSKNYKVRLSVKSRKQERSGKDVEGLRREMKIYHGHFEEWESKFNAEVALQGRDECSVEACDHE